MTTAPDPRVLDAQGQFIRPNIRDTFAMAALTGAVSTFGIPQSEMAVQELAECAYVLADAMMEARLK